MNRAGRAKATAQINAWGPDPWDPLECKRYIVEELGNAEQFPAQNPYSPGFITFLQRLEERYGEDYITSAARVLRNFLEDPGEGSPEEQALWHKWRVAQADRVWSMMVRGLEAIDFSRALPELPLTHSPARDRSPSSKHHRGPPLKSSISDSRQASPSTSTKKHLQAVTQHLLSQTNPKDWPYSGEGLDSVEPVKYSPPDASEANMTATAAHRYDEIDRSPYNPERFTRLDDLPREYENANAQTTSTVPLLQPARYQHRPKGMSQSISENNITFRRMDDPRQLPSQTSQYFDHYDTANLSVKEGSETSSSARARGRHPARTLSPPPKGLEDIKEDYSPEVIQNERFPMYQPVILPPNPAKRSRSPMKQLFGENGFLGRSTSMKEIPSEEHRKKGVKHLGEKFKQRVGGMTTSISHGDLSKLIPTSLSNRESPSKSGSIKAASTFPVSLSPPEQAKFYSEAELMIVATANNYLIIQKDEGRMSYESVVKITNFWAQKNRPQVIDFMFDQLTQRDLILSNLKTFRFYGPNAENAMSMNAMMNSWKTLAKEMSVRTFCTGDSTIRKQIQDIYKILELLGAPMVTFMAFQQIQVRILKVMREKQKERDELEAVKFGVERKWEPPGGFDPRDSAGSEAYTDPFTDH
ncbi:MAG: hypothetical protein LQ341_002454 [Variospora aurantia]|nr:MAG: hypothetical protein LQ341_002454 [Variospora aurantia]